MNGELTYLGTVVQSIVSLTSSLVTNSLIVVAKVFSDTLIILLQTVSRFCNSKSYSEVFFLFFFFFSAKISMYLQYFGGFLVRCFM